MPTSITFQDLLRAARECSRGVKWKDSIAAWTHPASIGVNCMRLWRALDSGTYRLGGYCVFEVTEPKRRLIRSPRFRDRVVQRAMCNTGLYEDLTRSNIYDNGACQKGKGTSFAMKRLTRLLHEYWLRHGTDGWVLRLDIRKFFDSIPHDRLKDMVRRLVRNPEYADRVCDVVDSFDDPGIGLGSQLSQLLAVAYLSPIDHYIKERLHVRAYVRYSDDMVLVHPDKGFLQKAWKDIETRLGDMGLVLNRKSTLHPLSQGIMFLKFKFRVLPSGRVTRTLARCNARRIKRRLRRLLDMEACGARPEGVAETCFTSWRAHAKQGTSQSTIRKVRQWLTQESSRPRKPQGAGRSS